MSSRHIRGPYVFNTITTITTGNLTVTNESIVVVDKTVGAATAVTIPAPSSTGGRRCIKVLDCKGDAATNNITITAASGNINGAANYVISENYGCVELMDDGVEWIVSGTAMTVSAAEIAFLNGVTAGTGQASKALVLDSSGDVTMPDLGSIGFGGVGKISWDTSDANANEMLIQLPAGGGTDVPVIVIGDTLEGDDLGLFDGIVSTTVAIMGATATATGPSLNFRKARGTNSAPTVVTTGDDMGSLDFYGCVAANEYVRGARILAEMTGTIATTRGPGVLTFQTATDAAPSVLTTALTINAVQTVTAEKGFVAKSSTAAAITTTRTLTAADSGGIFSVAKTSAYAITLPTPAQGLKFKFLVLDTGANAVTLSNGSAHLFGVVSVNNTNVAMTGTTLSLASGGSVGDWVEFEGIDATHYLVTGACIAAADITIA